MANSNSYQAKYNLISQIKLIVFSLAVFPTFIKSTLDTKTFIFSTNLCSGLEYFQHSVDIQAYFGCNSNIKPGTFYLSLLNNQTYNMINVVMEITLDKALDNNKSIELKVDGNSIFSKVNRISDNKFQHTIKETFNDIKANLELKMYEGITYNINSLQIDLKINECNTYKNNGSCESCLQQSSIVNTITGFCQNFNQNCFDPLNDNSSKVCQKCQVNFFLSSQGLCSNTCSFDEVKYNGKCLKQCPQSFYNSNGICNICNEECYSCTSQQQCQSCQSTYLLQEGSCVKSCSVGYFEKPSQIQRTCEKCHESCQSCKGTQQTDCISCKPSFLFQTVQTGFKCVINCDPGFIITTDPQRAGIQQIEIAEKYCASCYYTLDKNCVEICPQKTFLDSQNFLCKQCSTINCKQCNLNDECINCENGFTLQKTFLTPEKFQCKYCSSINCNKCNQDDKCLSCMNGFSLNINNQCIKCINGQYFDNSEKICKVCQDKKCEQCSSEGNVITCNQCKQYYKFEKKSSQCVFDDKKYLMQCSSPENCEREENIVKTSDAALSIISITNTILLIISFLFFPLGPFFWYTVQIQQQIGNFILIDNLKVLSLGPTVIQVFYQYNLFSLIPDSFLNTFEEEELYYPQSSSLSIMNAFKSQPIKKYFLNNCIYYFIILIISLIVLLIAKYRNRNANSFLQNPYYFQNQQYSINQTANEQNQSQTDQKQSKNKTQSTRNKKTSSMSENQKSDVNQKKYSISEVEISDLDLDKENEINQLSELEKKEQLYRQIQQQKVYSYQRRRKLLQIMEYNYFIRFQMLFGNYLLLSIATSFNDFTVTSVLDFIDIGVRSTMGLIYFILLIYLTYKVIIFDEKEIDFIESFPKYDALFRSINRQGIKRLFWLFLEYRKVIQICLFVFNDNKIVSVSIVTGINILFLGFIISQKPIQNNTYQKFIYLIEFIVIISNGNILGYILQPDENLNQKFILSLVTIITLTSLNIIVFGFLIMQVIIFIKFKFFSTFYIVEKEVLDTVEMRLDQSEDIMYKKAKLLNNLSNAEIDYYSKQWGLNPIFVQQIFKKAEDSYKKQILEEEQANQLKLESQNPYEEKQKMMQKYQQYKKRFLPLLLQQQNLRNQNAKQLKDRQRQQQDYFKQNTNNQLRYNCQNQIFQQTNLNLKQKKNQQLQDLCEKKTSPQLNHNDSCSINNNFSLDQPQIEMTSQVCTSDNLNYCPPAYKTNTKLNSNLNSQQNVKSKVHNINQKIQQSQLNDIQNFFTRSNQQSNQKQAKTQQQSNYNNSNKSNKSLKTINPQQDSSKNIQTKSHQTTQNDKKQQILQGNSHSQFQI